MRLYRDIRPVEWTVNSEGLNKIIMSIIGGKTPIKSDTWPPDKKVVLTQKCWQCDTCHWLGPRQTKFGSFQLRGLTGGGPAWNFSSNFPNTVPVAWLVRITGCLNIFHFNQKPPQEDLLSLIAGGERLPVMNSCLALCEMLLLSLILKLKSLSPVMLWGYADCNGLTPGVSLITACVDTQLVNDPTILMVQIRRCWCRPHIAVTFSLLW